MQLVTHTSKTRNSEYEIDKIRMNVFLICFFINAERATNEWATTELNTLSTHMCIPYISYGQQLCVRMAREWMQNMYGKSIISTIIYYAQRFFILKSRDIVWMIIKYFFSPIVETNCFTSQLLFPSLYFHCFNHSMNMFK